MKVFISWSGNRSRGIAERLHGFLKVCVQGTDPFFSEEDIRKGTSWFEAVSSQLAQANFGIICLTRENRTSPWVLFEAGALAKNLQMANVCPILFGLEVSDIDGPLSQFQLTTFRREEVFKLCQVINSRLSRALEEKILRTAFDALWRETEEQIGRIIDSDDPNLQVSGRTNREILEDIWHEIRRMHYREARALDDKFVLQLVDCLLAHTDALKEASCRGGLTTLRTLMTPVEHLIAGVHDRRTKELLIQKHGAIASSVWVP